jgi:hypothetical protein
MGGNDERENTLNQRREMDGSKTSTGVVVPQVQSCRCRTKPDAIDDSIVTTTGQAGFEGTVHFQGAFGWHP